MQAADRPMAQGIADTLRELAERCADAARSCPDEQAQEKLRELAGELAHEADSLTVRETAGQD
jgi:hypothetical protein